MDLNFSFLQQFILSLFDLALASFSCVLAYLENILHVILFDCAFENEMSSKLFENSFFVDVDLF